MNRHILTTLLAFTMIALFAAPAVAQPSADHRPTLAGDDLDDLMLALEREYRLSTLYQTAADRLGTGEPFATVRREQERRLRRLTRLFATHGLAIPDNPWRGRLTPPADRGAACLAGFRGELELERLYEAMSERSGEEELADIYQRASLRPRRSVEALRDCALEGQI